MKSLTEQQLREMLDAAYNLGATHARDTITDTINRGIGTEDPAINARIHEAQEFFDILIKNC